CDTQTYSGTRRMENTVTLDDLRCDGAAHDACGAKCRIFWREAWLKPAGERVASSRESILDDPAYAKLEELSGKATTRSNGSDKIFRCQATELLRASENVTWWSPVSLFREITCGNVGF